MISAANRRDSPGAALRQRLREQCGRRVRQARQGLGLTQTDVATSLGVSRSALSDLERGVHLFHLEIMLDLAAFLALPLSALLSEDLTPAEAHLLALLRRRNPAMTEYLARFLEVDTPIEACLFSAVTP